MRRSFAVAAACFVFAGCLLDPPQYDGTEFACGDPIGSCPSGYVCVDQVCRPEGEPSDPLGPDAGLPDRPDAAVSRPDADLPPPDADVPPPDADLPTPDAGQPPLVTVVLTGNDVYETSIDESYPYDNEGSRQLFRIDADPARIGLLRIDLSSLPPGAVVVSAELSVEISEPLEDGELVGHRLLESWAEMEATWYERRSGVWWTTDGAGTGSYDPSPLFSMSAPDLGPLTIPLPTATVQAWLDQPATNYGIRWTSTSPNGHGVTFYSTDASSHPEPELRIRYYSE